MNIPKCEACEKQGVVTLEVESWGTAPPSTKVSHHYCVKCAEAEEEKHEGSQNSFARRLAVVPEVGMPCTESVGSDSYPATVIEVSNNGKKVRVQQNAFKASAGSNYYTDQRYDIDENTLQGEIHTYSLRTNGRWIIQGGTKGCGQYLHLGFRRAYSDPHF